MDAYETPSTATGAPVAVAGYPGPFPVGRYALKLRDRLREFQRVAVIGEVCGLRIGRGPNVYFELRDQQGALPCAMWRDDFDRQALAEDAFADGLEVVAAGGLDFYPGGPQASPRLQFRVRELRLAGEGDLLARLARLRRELSADGLFEPQKLLPRPVLPRRIGVVTSRDGAARRDLLAGLERRGWRGTVVWGDAPVQDRRAAAAIRRSVRDLAAFGGVDVIVVCRGGGSIADLWAFCDEALCREIAVLAVPVISAVGHETDRTLIDDVAAVSCSTPTHAAEAAVPLECTRAREAMAAHARRLNTLGRAALASRARTLAASSRAPREHLDRHRRRLHQLTRELRAASARGLAGRGEFQRRIAALVLDRKLEATRVAAAAGRRSLDANAQRLGRASEGIGRRRSLALGEQAAALRAPDPDRTLERGFAVALDDAGEPLAGVLALREAGSFDLQLSDGRVPAQVDDSQERERGAP
ncbi:MAG: exodeoxyribonuclease VII large subunit [Thermoleophilaceae bacterium]